MNVSPWRLTAREAEALDATCRYAGDKRGARELGLTLSAYRQGRDRSYNKMRYRDPTLTPERCIVAWIRWRMENPAL